METIAFKMLSLLTRELRCEAQSAPTPNWIEVGHDAGPLDLGWRSKAHDKVNSAEGRGVDEFYRLESITVH